MKKQLIIPVYILCLCVACKNSVAPNKPENLIPEKQMVAVLVDMALFNAAKGINKKTLEKNGVILEQYIYNKHQIDSIQFESSNNYYTFHLDTYNSIYSKVQDSLEALKKEYKVLEEQEEKILKKENDSIKQLNKNRDKTNLNNFSRARNNAKKQIKEN